MFQTLYVGKLLGIKVYIHWTFWLMAMYIVLTNLGQGFSFAVKALGFVFAVFGCVFLHEMGHALAGRLFKIPTLDITLLPIGGVARMGDFQRAPFAELVVALAGPMVNVVIAAALILGLSINATLNSASEGGVAGMGPFEQLLLANIGLVLFNMLPSFPMDGGRVLRSLLAFVMPYSRATQYAARTGQVMAIFMFVCGIYYFDRFGISLLLIAGMVFAVCSGELLKERIASAREQMNNNPFPFGPNAYQSSSSTNGDDIVDAVEVKRVR
jgi:Zn-dependent protease